MWSLKVDQFCREKEDKRTPFPPLPEARRARELLPGEKARRDQEPLLQSSGGWDTQLGDPSEGQDVKADIADPDGLVQVEFNDGDLLGRALVAQEAPTVPAAREEGRENTGEPFGARLGALLPKRVGEDAEEASGGNRMKEEVPNPVLNIRKRDVGRWLIPRQTLGLSSSEWHRGLSVGLGFGRDDSPVLSGNAGAQT